MALFWCGRAAAQEQGQLREVAPALDSYRAGALDGRFSFWHGFQLTRAGQDVDLGFFGGNAEAIFGASPDAMEKMSTFRTLRTVGTVLFVVGLGAMLTDLVLVADKTSPFYDNSVQPAFEAMLLGGLVVGLSGSLMIAGANSYLSDAMDLYNRDLYDRLRGNSGASARVRPIGLSLSGRF
jgi:hypothetical protein